MHVGKRGQSATFLTFSHAFAGDVFGNVLRRLVELAQQEIAWVFYGDKKPFPMHGTDLKTIARWRFDYQNFKI